MRVQSSTKHIISLAIVFLLLFTLIPSQVAYASTVETRYCTSTSETYKTITVKKLLTTNTASDLSASIANGRRFGVRVWKTNTSETETEITSGTPVATVIHAGTSDDDGEYSATWACPETVLASTDRIVVRVYSTKQTPISWSLLQTFITEQLGASKLDSATWTVYYYLYLSGTAVLFRYGSSTYPSRITNFVWTPAVTTAWHDVSSWQLNLQTRQTQTIALWNFNQLARQWSSVTLWKSIASISSTYFYSEYDDGDINKYSWNNYSEVWIAEEGDAIFTDATTTTIEQGKFGKVITVYGIIRSFHYFNITGIPENAEITEAKLEFHVFIDGSDNDFNITIQNGQPNYPHKPLILSDYWKDYYAGNGGQLSTVGLVGEQKYNITLNSDGIGWINKTGMTKLCLRSDRDINGIEPDLGVYEFVQYYTRDKGESYSPKLYLTYVTYSSFNLLTRLWQTITPSWLFGFGTKIWTDAAARSYNLVTMAWQNISWIFYLGTSIWTDIAIWGASLVAMMWNDVATYTFNLLSMAWHDLTWLFTLLPALPEWVNVALWTLILQPQSRSGLLLICIAIGIILSLGFVRLLAVRKRKTTQTTAEMLYRLSYRIRK